MSDFTPGVERAKAAGYAIEAHAYEGTGTEQVRESLSVIAKKIRDGRLDPDVRGWAGDTLIAAGRPATVRAKVQALLDAFRSKTMYLPDPVGAEYIASAAATACLRPGLCVRARDCDDGTVFMGSAVLSIGIPVRIMKQSFGPGKQEHVLIEAQDSDGTWFPVDPSTNLSAGEKVRAVTEETIDPMDVVGSHGTAGAEIVTLGAVPGELEVLPAEAAREVRKVGDTWTERRYGQWWKHVGTGWVSVGSGDACCAACAEGKPCAGEAGAPEVTEFAETKKGAGSDGDEEGCSACEAAAAKMKGSGKLARYGLTGFARALPALSRRPPVHRIHVHRTAGAGASDTSGGSSVPIAPVLSPIAKPTTNIGAGSLAFVAVATILAGGIGYAVAKRRCESPRRRAA